MTIATNLITLALKTSGINGVGQAPATADIDDAFSILNDMIRQWQIQRTVMVIPTQLSIFPNLVTDQPFWTPFENVLLTTLTVRLLSAFGLPPDETMSKLAETAMGLFQANNQQQIAPLHAAPGIPTTCMQVIFLALRTAGRITDQQSVSDGSKDVADAMMLLSMMVAQWQAKRWLVPNLIDMAVTSTGAVSYSIGPARPDRIEAAYVRLNPTSAHPLDTPLVVLQSHEAYSKIQLKNLSTFPEAVFYDSAWPVGSIFPWPVPLANIYEIHLLFKAALPTFSLTTDLINLPQEYVQALVKGLAIEICMASGTPPRPDLVAAYRAALNTIRMSNVQVGALSMPGGLGGGRNSGPSFVGTGLGRAFILDQGAVL